MRRRTRPFLALVLAFSGCGLTESTGYPPGYFDLALLDGDLTAAVRDYVRRTPAEGIAPEDVRGASISPSIDRGNPVVATQRYRGVRVAGGWREFSIDWRTGKVTDTRDQWVRIAAGHTADPTLAAPAARDIARAEWSDADGATCRTPDDLEFRRVDDTTARLAWKVYLYRENLSLGRVMYVDAHTGEIFGENTYRIGDEDADDE